MCKTDGVSIPEPLSRRSRRTRADVHRAALRLAESVPLDDITIDQIAEAAGVSRRTFHNHFSGKLEAFLPDFSATDPEAIARFKAAAEPDLLDAVAELLRSRIMVFQANDAAIGAATLALVRENDALQPLIRERLRQSDAQLREAVGERLGVAANSSRAITVANIIGAIERSALDYWSEPGQTIGLPEALDVVLDDAQDVLRHLN